MGQRAGGEMVSIANTGLTLACPRFVPDSPGLVPSLPGTWKPLRNGQLSRFPQAVPAFFKKLCHIVPQAIFERKFSKSRKVNIGCRHGSRMGILTFLGTGFNTVIPGMRGMREMRDFPCDRFPIRGAAGHTLPTGRVSAFVDGCVPGRWC